MTRAMYKYILDGKVHECYWAMHCTEKVMLNRIKEQCKTVKAELLSITILYN